MLLLWQAARGAVGNGRRMPLICVGHPLLSHCLRLLLPPTCSFGELHAALRAMEADGEDAPVMLHESPAGITIHFTF